MRSIKHHKYYLIFTGTFFLFLERYSFEQTSLYLILMILFGGMIGLWLWQIFKHGSTISESTLSRWHVAFAVALFVSAIFSIDPSRSWRFGWGWLAALLSFSIFISFGRTVFQKNAAHLVDVLLGISFLFVLFGAIEFLLWLPRYWSYFQATGGWPQFVRLEGFSFSSNALGFLAATFGTFAFAKWKFARSEQNFWLYGAGLATLVLWGTGSSGAYLSAGFGLAIIVILELWPVLQTWWSRFSFAPKIAVLFILLLLVAILVGGGWQIAAEDVGLRDRLFIWEVGLRTFWQYPLFGAGLNTYGTFYNAERIGKIIYWHTHNLWINILAEIGLIGGLLVLGMIVQFGRLLITKWDQLLESDVAKIALAGVGAVIAHTLFETPIFSAMGLAAIMLATIYLALDDQVAVTPNYGRLSWLFPALGVMLVIVSIYNVSLRDSFDRGISFAEDGDWSASAAEFEQLLSRYPYPESSVLQASAMAHGMLAAESQSHRQIGIERYERLIQLEPSWGANRANLAWLHHLNGDNQEALELFAEASAIRPEQAVFALNGVLLAEEYDLSSDNKFVSNELAYASVRAWHGAPFWQESAPRRTILENDGEIACFSRPSRVPCTAFIDQGLTDAWEMLSNGDKEGANTSFESFVADNGIAEDASAVFGLALANGLELTDMPDARLTGAHSTIHPFMPPLWRDVETLTIETLKLDLDVILNQTEQGFGRLGYDTYPKFLFSRKGLPYDLLPGIRCFTVDDYWAWQLSTLADWYRTNERDELAELIDTELLGADGRGIGSCIRPIVSE